VLSRRIRPAWLALGAAVLLYVIHTRLLGARLQDDAFISFRYARNLADGHGLVFNPGERVEGYTNFLWTVIHSVPFLFSRAADPVPLARALSLLSGIATILASYRLARDVASGAKLTPLAVPVLVAGNWAFAINSMTGLETIFFAFLITLATLIFAQELQDLRYRGSSVVYALATLTRPEAGGLFVLSVLAVLPVLLRPRRPGSTAAGPAYLVRVIVPFATLVGLHLAFRLAYYGALVPNTFFAKMGVDLPAGMATRSSYLLGFFDKAMDLFGVMSALIVLFAIAFVRTPSARLVTAGVLFAFANVALSGADFMIGYRYLVPYLPLMFAAAAGGASFLADRWMRRWQRTDPGATGIELEAGFLIISLFACAKWMKHSQERLGPFEQIRRRVAVDANVMLGDWLARRFDPGASVVTMEVGEIGFRSGLRVIDLSGLTDATIATMPGNVLDRQIDPDAILAKRPEAFVLVSRRQARYESAATWFPSSEELLRNNPYWPPGSSARLLGHPSMRQDYRFVMQAPPYPKLVRGTDGELSPGDLDIRGGTSITYYLELYVRKDVPVDALN
jgi:hypothetical protein